MTVRDSGLQPERTALAWTRTALTLAVNGLIVTRAGIVERDAASIAAGAILAVLSFLLMAQAHARRNQLRTAAPGAAPARSMLVASGATVCAAVIACGLIAWRRLLL